MKRKVCALNWKVKVPFGLGLISLKSADIVSGQAESEYKDG